MNNWLGYLLLGLLVLLAVPIVIPYLQNFLFLGTTVERFDPAQEQRLFDSVNRRVPEADITALGFEREGVYEVDLKMAKAVFAMWRHAQSATYLGVYTLNGQELTQDAYIDLVSILSLEPNVGVTTGTTKDGHTEAKLAGDYLQSFSGLPLSALFDLHMQAEAYVAQREKVDPEPIDLTGKQALLIATRDNARKKMLRPWMALRIPWRFWVGRHLYHNKTIEQLHGPL